MSFLLRYWAGAERTLLEGRWLGERGPVKGKENYEKKGLLFSLLQGGEQEEALEKAVLETGLLGRQYPTMRMCILRLSEPPEDPDLFRKALWEAARAARQAEGWEAVSEFCGSHRLVILLCGSWKTLCGPGPVLSILTQTCSQGLLGKKLFLAVGPRVERLDQVYRSYGEAKRVEQNLFFLGYGRASFRAGGKRDAFAPIEGEMREEFQQVLEEGREEVLEKALEKLSRELEKREAVLTPFLFHFYLSLLWKLEKDYFRSVPQKEKERQKEWEATVWRLENLDTMEEIHGFLLSRAREAFSRREKWESGNLAVCRIRQMIGQNYGQELSVKHLAETVYLTPNYLSGMFKRQTGQTIGEYLTQVRVCRAKELLRDPCLKFYQISQQVGYEDPNYFAKIFKKHVGVTPSEYRARHAGKTEGSS